MDELKKLLAEFVDKISPLLTEKTEETEDTAEDVVETVETEVETEETTEDSAEVTRTETTTETITETVNMETGEGTVKRTEESVITFKDGVYYGI